MAEGTEQDGGLANLNAVKCPKCGAQMPFFRLPDSLHQMMWGGWTCPDCGCKMDKWGKAVDTEDATTG